MVPAASLSVSAALSLGTAVLGLFMALPLIPLVRKRLQSVAGNVRAVAGTCASPISWARAACIAPIPRCAACSTGPSPPSEPSTTAMCAACKYRHGNDEFEVCRHGNVADRSAEAALKRDYDGMESKNYAGVAPCDDKSDYAGVVGR